VTPENVGQQFTTLYRGIATQSHSMKDVDFDNLGSHWTPDQDVAASFALSRAGDTYFEREPKVLRGIVISARVPHEHIIDPNSEEGEYWRETMDVYSPEHTEQEHTVRPGGEVHVTGVTRLKFRNGETEAHDFTRFPKSGRS